MDNLREKLMKLLEEALDYSRMCREIKRFTGREEENPHKTAADYLIANGVTSQRWIPVTERLPEDDLPKGSKVKQIKVLVAYMRNGYWVVRTNLRKKGMWYGKPDKWDWSVSDPISHWMPLPEPPNEE